MPTSHWSPCNQIILSRMRDSEQPVTSLFFYNSGRGFTNSKLKRISNLKEIFKHKSKPVRSPRTNDTKPHSHQTRNQTVESNRLSETKRSLFAKEQKRTLTNFTVFNPRLPNLFARQHEVLHMKSLQLTEEDADNPGNTNTDKSVDLAGLTKTKKYLHLLTSNKNFKSETEHKMGKAESFHLCNLEFNENYRHTVNVKEQNKKKKEVKESVRIRRKKAENSQKGHIKRVSMFEIEGPKAFSMNPNIQQRQPSQRRYKIQTIYMSERQKQFKREPRNRPIKERQGSHQLRAWDNNSDSSGEYF